MELLHMEIEPGAPTQMPDWPLFNPVNEMRGAHSGMMEGTFALPLDVRGHIPLGAVLGLIRQIVDFASERLTDEDRERFTQLTMRFTPTE